MASSDVGEIECAKDTGELLALALAFLSRLSAALKRIIRYERDEKGNLVSDGTLRVYHQRADEAGKAEGNANKAGFTVEEEYCTLKVLQ